MAQGKVQSFSQKKTEAQVIIKELRKRQGWTQQKMAEVLGVRRSTISDWERGASLSRETLIGMRIGIAAAMGIPQEELILYLPDPEDRVS